MSETILSILPRGMQPPQIISYNASNVPVAQLNIYSDVLSTEQLFDYGLNFIRIQLFTIPGLFLARAVGRRQPLGDGQSRPDRRCMPTASPPTTSATPSRPTNVVIPSGTAKMGNYEYNVDINMSVPRVSGVQPAAGQVRRRHAGAAGRCRPVTDSHQPQTNVVRVDGRRPPI